MNQRGSVSIPFAVFIALACLTWGWIAGRAIKAHQADNKLASGYCSDNSPAEWAAEWATGKMTQAEYQDLMKGRAAVCP